jgi:hypothetical protein
MITNCENCNEKLDVTGDDPVVLCPTCNVQTRVPLPPIPKPRRRGFSVLRVGLAIVILLMGLAIIGAAASAPAETTLMAAVTLLGFVVAIVWVVFPFLVMSSLGRIERLLEQQMTHANSRLDLIASDARDQRIVR